MKTNFRRLTLFVFLLLPHIGSFAGIAHADEVKHANTKAIPSALQYCTVCHGTQFKGDFATGAPNLTGLPAWYLEKQLRAFKAGTRGLHEKDISGHEMRAAAESLDNKTIQLAISTIESLSRREGLNTEEWQKIAFNDDTTLKASATKGQTLFTTCASCHGAKAEGNKALKAPPLQGLNNWYIAKQLIHFKENIRGNEQADSASLQMKAAAKMLKSRQDIVDVVSYIDQLQ